MLNPKKNSINTIFTRNRKYSESKIQMKDIREDNELSATAKSQASVSVDKEPKYNEEHV